ncbi:MAG: hypothetical protein R3B45_11965 [Bdellovibrionota bacterium]
MIRKFLFRQDGMSMISVIIAMGMIAVIISILANIQKDSLDLYSRMSTQADIEETRKLVRDRFNCSTTSASMPALCKLKKGKYAIELRDNKGKVFVKGDQPYTQRGKDFQLRAFCVNPKIGGEGKILVELNRIRYDEDYETKSKLKWGEKYVRSGWQDLFVGLPLPCYYGNN